MYENIIVDLKCLMFLLFVYVNIFFFLGVIIICIYGKVHILKLYIKKNVCLNFNNFLVVYEHCGLMNYIVALILLSQSDIVGRIFLSFSERPQHPRTSTRSRVDRRSIIRYSRSPLGTSERDEKRDK